MSLQLRCSPFRRAGFALGLALLVMAARTLHAANYQEASAPGQTTAFFESNRVVPLQLELSADALASLRQDRRKSVPAQVREGSRVFSNVLVHLKGTRGSIRSIDDKPSFTLQFPGLSAVERFHGFSKIHLNNSVEDPTFLNQFLGSRLFEAAGLPSPRTTFATVRLAARDLGLYVLQEGLTEEFFTERYPGSPMLVFEPGRGQDVDQLRLPKWGQAATWADSRDRLVQALNSPSGPSRWELLGETISLDRFLTFMALEVILGHRDGYCLARNNFRLVYEIQQQKFFFLPYGMDQLLGNPQALWRPDMSGEVARVVMQTPEGRIAYRQRIGQVVTNTFDPEKLVSLVEEQRRQLIPWLSARARRDFQQEVTALEQRIRERRRFLDQQLLLPEQGPVRFQDSEASLTDWSPRDVPEGGQLQRIKGSNLAEEVLWIQAGPRTAASWRSAVTLVPGRYRFSGRVRTVGVRPLPFGSRQGAALRVADIPIESIPTLTGDHPWTDLSVDFELKQESRVVEMVCELRASGGEVSFDLPSLKLRQLSHY